MTKMIHKSALIFLSYFTHFFSPKKRLEIYFVDPFNLELFGVVVLLGISSKLKNAVEYLISLKRSFLLLSVWGKKQVLGKRVVWVFLTISVSRRELNFQDTCPFVPHFPVLVCSHYHHPLLSHPVHPTMAFLSPLPRTEAAGLCLGWSCTCKTCLAGQSITELCQVFLRSALPWFFLPLLASTFCKICRF